MRLNDPNEDIPLLPHYADLVFDEINNVPVREYPLPPQILGRMKRIEAKLDGTHFVKLLPMDSSNYHGTHDETSITNSFSNEPGKAFYELRRKSLFLYTGTFTDVTKGLMLMCSVYPADIEDLTSEVDMSVDPTSTTLGFPKELHELLGRQVAIIYKSSKEKPLPLSEREQKFEYDLQRAINSLRGQSEEEDIIAELPSSYDRGDEGYEY